MYRFNPDEIYRVNFDQALNRMLSRVSDAREKRPSSPIYDTLAPVAQEVALLNIIRMIHADQFSLEDATGENLDRWGFIFGVFRQAATSAVRIGEMIDTAGNNMIVPIGTKFAVPNVSGGIRFTLTQSTPYVLLECDEPGTIGNAYIGPILPITAVNNLAEARIIGTQTPAQNDETDDNYRARIIDRINQKSFAGNMAGYREFVREIPGVGDVMIFPIWNGGGTVKLSIIDSSLNVATPEFVMAVQELIDPIPYNQLGLGAAPIGHRVTVTTPEAVPVRISANLYLRPGYTLPQIQVPAEIAIDDYLYGLRNEWAMSARLMIDELANTRDYDGDLILFLARISSILIGVEGVANVTNVTINGVPDDLVLRQDKLSQLLPMFGSVVLSEND